MPATLCCAPVPANRGAKGLTSIAATARTRALAAVLGLVLAAPAFSTPAASPRPPDQAPERLVLTCIESSGTQAVAAALVAEAFRRNGLALSVEAVPGERASAMTREGLSDGEVSRIEAYFVTHPQLVRVEPALMATEAAVFVRAADPRFAGRTVVAAADLRGLRVGIVRGVMQTERGVASLDRVETVASARQLHRMLQSGRLDAIVDSPLSHRRYRMPDGSPAATRQAGDLGAEPVFLGVQARQRDLAARLRKTIESMQASGEWDLVRARAEDAYVSQPDR